MVLCDLTERALVYKNHDNEIAVLAVSDVRTGDLLDLTAATAVQICVGGASVSSDTAPTVVSWEEIDAGWIIKFKAGLIPNIPTGEHFAAIIVFSAVYPNGLVLTHEFPLRITEIC
jgi:hypothetical protein